MSRRIVLVVMVAVAVLASGFVGVTDSSGSRSHRGHGRTPIDWEVAGTIVSVQLPSTSVDFMPGLLIDAFLKGAPGKARFRVLVRAGAPKNLTKCGEPLAYLPDGNGQEAVSVDMVITFEDQSMIFATMDPVLGGWNCFTGEPSVANMVIAGGTGKYESAEGNFRGVFDTPFVGDSGALLAETGTIKGWIKR